MFLIKILKPQFWIKGQQQNINESQKNINESLCSVKAVTAAAAAAVCCEGDKNVLSFQATKEKS